MRLAALISTLLASPALACDATPDRISVMLHAKHVNQSADSVLSDNVFGAFLGWECGRWGADIGTYRNSFDDVSVSLTGSFDVLQGYNWDVSLFAGAAHYPSLGYRDGQYLGEGAVFLGGVQARYGHFYTQIMPADGRYTDGVVSFGVTFETGD